jgi:hypothetical protein
MTTAIAEKQPTYITQPGSNSKLGAKIASWSLPAIDTCPGATEFCKGLCYATRSHFASKHVQALYARNEKLSRRPDFVAKVIAELTRHPVETVRIHVSGDYYSVAYVNKWAKICAALPNIKFFTYTRSWRKPAFLPALLALGALPNVQLWWSEDRETGPSPIVPGVRACLLLKDLDDEKLIDPARHKLLFRDMGHRKVALYRDQLKAINGVRVCPHEQLSRRAKLPEGKVQPKVTCSDCRICIKPPRVIQIGMTA